MKGKTHFAFEAVSWCVGKPIITYKNFDILPYYYGTINKMNIFKEIYGEDNFKNCIRSFLDNHDPDLNYSNEETRFSFIIEFEFDYPDEEIMFYLKLKYEKEFDDFIHCVEINTLI